MIIRIASRISDDDDVITASAFPASPKRAVLVGTWSHAISSAAMFGSPQPFRFFTIYTGMLRMLACTTQVWVYSLMWRP